MRRKLEPHKIKIMNNNQQKFIDFINKLPVAADVRQNLLAKLAGPDGAEAVKAEIKMMLEDAALNVQVNEALNKADESLKKDLADIEAQARQLVSAVSKDLDGHALQKARSTINGN